MIFCECVISRLVGILVTVMGDVFPEVKQHEAHIREIIKEEEETFEKTLQKVWIYIMNSVWACLLLLLFYKKNLGIGNSNLELARQFLSLASIMD